MADRFLKQEDYRLKVFPFPDMEGFSEKEKDEPDYNLAMAKAVHSLYNKDKTAFGLSMCELFDQLRLYGQGRQSPDIYKTFFSSQVTSSSSAADDIDGSGMRNREYQAKGWMNVDWEEIFSFMPKFSNILAGYLSTDYDIRATNIDVDSGAEEESRMLDFWATTQFIGDINQLKKKAGLPLEKLDYIPSSLQELQDIKKEGGFKQPYVMELEELLKHTEEISDWDTSLREKIREDLKDLNVAFACWDYDDETCKVKWEYVDPKDAIIQYSRYNDFKSSDFKGFYKLHTISELRSQGFDGNRLMEVANQVSNVYDNPSEHEWNKSKKGSGYDYKYEDYRVMVMYLWWVDAEDERKIEYETANGDKRYFDYEENILKRREDRKRNFNQKYKGRKIFIDNKPDGYYLQGREKVKSIRRRKVRHLKWLVGTDLIYDYGVMPNQVRPRYSEPELPVVGFKINGKSLTHTLRKVCDWFNIGAARFENTLSKAVDAGFAVDMSVMQSSGDGGKKYNPLKALQIHREGGYYFYKGMPGGIPRGGSPVPITALPGTLREGIESSIIIMDRCIKFVEDLTGLSPVALGATPPPKSQVGTTEMSLRSSYAGLKPLENAIRSIKRDLAMSSAEAIQQAIHVDQRARDEYAKVIGLDGVERIRAARKLHVQYGINLVARPTEEQRKELISDINLAYQKKSQGIAGLNEAQKAQLILEIDNGGNLYRILYKMAYWIRKDQERLDKERIEGIDRQGMWNERLKKIDRDNVLTQEKAKQQNIQLEKELDTRSKVIINDNETRNRIREKLAERNTEYRNRLIQEGNEVQQEG
jgi:hypothetical protein